MLYHINRISHMVRGSVTLWRLGLGGRVRIVQVEFTPSVARRGTHTYHVFRCAQAALQWFQWQSPVYRTVKYMRVKPYTESENTQKCSLSSAPRISRMAPRRGT